MKILFIGDSLIRGSQGVSFVKQLAKAHPEWQIENAGVNGETLNKIAGRLKTRLETGKHYDAIVLDGGANDILLPTFKQKGFLFRKALNHLLKQGHTPFDPETFEANYRDLLAWLKTRTSAKIVLLTLGCMNENLSAATNTQRHIYNQIIRQAAADFGMALADPTEKIAETLRRKPIRDYLMPGFFRTAWFDLIACRLGLADYLSQKRGLHLTIDGGHLNSAGAAIFKQEIENVLLAETACV